jgi:hypothetical protein
VQKVNSFSHKGLRNFLRAAQDICSDVGPWGADWFICKVMDKTQQAASPYNNIMQSEFTNFGSQFIGVRSQNLADFILNLPKNAWKMNFLALNKIQI